MSSRKRNRRRDLTIIFLGFTSHIYSCKSLTIDLHIHCRRQLQPLVWRRGRLHHRRCSPITSKAFSKPDAEDEHENEGQQNRSPLKIESSAVLQRLLGDNFSSLRTAVAAFCAGAFAAIVFSVILFSATYLSDEGTPYLRAVPTPSSSSRRGGTAIFAATQQQTTRATTLYRSILEELDDRYVDKIRSLELFDTATRAMLSTLDPYTEYLSPRDVLQRRQRVGIGAFVMKAGKSELLDGKPLSTVMASLPSPFALPSQLLPSRDAQYLRAQRDGFDVVLALESYAYDAGLRVGDVILEIDDQPIAGDRLERVRERLQGAPGSKVKITFKRPGATDVKSVDVERNVVQFPNVPYAGILSNDPTPSTKAAVPDSSDDIGYIQLRRFGLDAGLSMEKAIRSIQSDRMKGLILDLRDNSGGELLSAVQTASLFFPDDTYLGSSEGKGSLYPNESYRSGKLDLTQYGYTSNSMPSGGDSSVFKTAKQMVDPVKTNIVILTNEKTASASEFLAGAFQDLDKGVIIGNDKSTLGKGIGQREIGLPNGGALKLTYHEFYTPSGRCVQRNLNPEKEEGQPKKQFYTKNGRVIKDRRGIDVDYRAEPKSSLLSSLLSSSGAYFEFATGFTSRHQFSADFAVDDLIYNDFKTFILKEQRAGNLKLENSFDEERLLHNIHMLSVESKLSDSNLVQSSVAHLQGTVVKDLLSEFDTCKDIIRRELEKNILARKFPESELIERSVKSDELVREAVRIIEDTDRYRSILGQQ